MRYFNFILLLLTLTVFACNNDSKPGETEPNQENKTNSKDTIKENRTEKPVDTATVKIENNVPDGSILKVGHLNTAEITSKMPEVKSVEVQLQNFAIKLDNDLKKEANTFQSKYDAYASDTSMSEALYQIRLIELQQMEQRLQELRVNSENELARKRQVLYEPIYNKVKKAIADVADEYGYGHVIDESIGSLVYGNSSYDITDLVMKKLGLK
jgi:outer membrane protein